MASSIASSSSTSPRASDRSGVAAPLTDFNSFPDLPIELRQEIWKNAYYHPRVVDLQIEFIRQHDLHADLQDTSGVPFKYKSKCKPPAILAVSLEARTEGLRHYTLEFGTRFEDQDVQNRGYSVLIETPSRIFVNWACDIICPIIPDQSQCTRCDSATILCEAMERHEKVRRIAFNIETSFWVSSFCLEYDPFDNIIFYAATYPPTSQHRRQLGLIEPATYSNINSVELDLENPDNAFSSVGISPTNQGLTTGIFKAAQADIDHELWGYVWEKAMPGVRYMLMT